MTQDRRQQVEAVALEVLASGADELSGGVDPRSISPTPGGTRTALAWIPGQLAAPRDAALVVADRSGRVVPPPAPHRGYGPATRTSPDGRRLAVTVRGLTEVGVWRYDVGRGTLTPLAGSALRVGRPRVLFRLDPTELQLVCAPGRCCNVAPEGQGFYAVQSMENPPPPVVTHINLVENWIEELKV